MLDMFIKLWPVWVTITGVLITMVIRHERLAGRLGRAEAEIGFNKECITKLNMDNRKQFESLDNNLKESNKIMMSLGNAVSQLKGVIEGMTK